MQPVWSRGCLKPRVLEDPLLLSPHPQKRREAGWGWGDQHSLWEGLQSPGYLNSWPHPGDSNHPRKLPALRCGRSTNCPDLRKSA